MRQRVQLYKRTGFADIDPAATVGAVLGVNLRWPDGTLVEPNQLVGVPSASAGTTDDLDEGQWNLWFTERRAQDAVGSILTDSANVTLRYVAGASITADLTDLPDTGEGALLAIDRDAKGRVTGTREVEDADLPAIDAIADTALGAPRLVAIANGRAYLPDLADPADVARLAGFTAHAADADAPVRVMRQLVAAEPAWSWAPGPVYAATTGGTFTQSQPASGALVDVGVAVTTTSISLRLRPPILR